MKLRSTSLLLGATLAAGMLLSGCGDPGTQIVLKDGRTITPQFCFKKPKPGSWEGSSNWAYTEAEVDGNRRAARLVDRSDREVRTYQTKLSEECGIHYTVTSYDKEVEAGNYSRFILTLKNVTDTPIEVDRLQVFDFEWEGNPTISGNTDGSVFISEDGGSFLAVEHPMARLSIVKPKTLVWTAEDVARGTMTFPVHSKGGDITLTFAYTGGSHRTDIAKVEIVGAAIADAHPGFTGSRSEGNVYTLQNVPPGAHTVQVTFAYEDNNRNPKTAGKIDVAGAVRQDGKIRLNAWVPINDVLRPGETWNYSVVFGTAVEASQLRRAFQAYLNEERAHPYRIFPHYNSWYDLCINRNDAPWNKRMNEQECLDTMAAVRTELGKRGVHLDSYLWDDGWDDWNSLWDFHPGFPNGFTKIAQAAQAEDAGISAWLSPCGGYGGSQAARIAYAKREGILGPNEHLMRLSQPTYYAAFRDRCVAMIKDYGMNMFKFDRMGSGHDAIGASPAHAPDLQAIVRLIGELRAAKQDVFINATVGTWASPFWVMWADSIWRGGNDWEGLGPGPERERWITYRDNKIYDRFVAPAPLFPLNSMMMHGIIVGEKGPPACMDRSNTPASTRAFANEVWMGMACGTGLQEYYVTPHLMHPEWWDILATAIKWVKRNEETLRDVHWIGADPNTGKAYNIYGYAALGDEHGIVTLRNPSEQPQTITISLAEALELAKKAEPEDDDGFGDTSAFDTELERVTFAYTSDPTATVPAFQDLTTPVTITLEPFGVRVMEVELD